ncbi:caspase family protein [Rhizobium sp. KVB221]|uniref:Caspase family protein n=1 Tax=Rhizobium setariae TaxID=2801340 RepID=A0A937CQR3_9HYPH|nr:caspase family protein [Rhizobium setariae]
MLRFLSVALMLASPGLAQAGRTFALVIGVNDYRFVPVLDGARDDARDISSALGRMGADQIVTLVDADVTKQNIVQAWHLLASQAKAGDVIFMSYAGHGAQAPERVAGSEKDKLDEFWVLPGFDPKNISGTWHETVFDNELHQWFSEVSSRGVHVVYVSDSCHAGGMDRAVTGKFRYVEFGKDRLLGELISLMLKEQQPEPTVESVLPENVTLLAATAEALPVPEVVINGKPRGALSWSVARALEGMADRDGDGALMRHELEDYVFATVRMRSESLQTPVFTPVAARGSRELLLSLKPDGEMLVASRPAGQTGQNPIPVARELGFTPVLTVSVEGSATRPENTVEGKHPYVWDAGKGVFKTPNGDLAAENISPFTVNDVVQKYILLDFLQAMATRNTSLVRIDPEKPLYYANEKIKFDAEPGKYSNTIVFNLANTGEVQFLDMVLNGEPVKKTFLREMRVVPPFGSDHLVEISSDEPLEAVGRAMERGVAPKELLQMLTSRIDGKIASIAIIPIYTRAR